MFIARRHDAATDDRRRGIKRIIVNVDQIDNQSGSIERVVAHRHNAIDAGPTLANCHGMK